MYTYLFMDELDGNPMSIGHIIDVNIDDSDPDEALGIARDLLDLLLGMEIGQTNDGMNAATIKRIS